MHLRTQRLSLPRTTKQELKSKYVDIVMPQKKTTGHQEGEFKQVNGEPF